MDLAHDNRVFNITPKINVYDAFVHGSNILLCSPVKNQSGRFDGRTFRFYIYDIKNGESVPRDSVPCLIINWLLERTFYNTQNVSSGRPLVCLYML